MRNKMKVELGDMQINTQRDCSFLTTMMLYPASPEAATRFLKFVNASPTPFHAVQNASVRLEKAGFLKVTKSFFLIAPFSHIISLIR
jgi:hypothetical protein